MVGTLQMKHILIETKLGGEAGTDYSEDGDANSGSSIEESSSGVDEDNGEVKGKGKDGGKKDYAKIFIDGLVNLLNDKEIREALNKHPAFALNVDNIFNILDGVVPGVKGLQDDLVETIKIISPYTMMGPKDAPILKKILKIVASGKETTDEEFISVGKSITKVGGPFLLSLVEGLKMAPLQSINDKLKAMNLKAVAAKFLQGHLLNMVENGIDTLFSILNDLINIVSAHEKRGMRKRRF